MLGERGSISVQCFEFLIGAEGGGRVLKRCLTEGQESGTKKKNLFKIIISHTVRCFDFFDRCQGGRPAIGGGEGFKRLPPEEEKVHLTLKFSFII